MELYGWPYPMGCILRTVGAADHRPRAYATLAICLRNMLKVDLLVLEVAEALPRHNLERNDPYDGTFLDRPARRCRRIVQRRLRFYRKHMPISSRAGC